MEMRVQVLHSGVVGFSVWCGSWRWFKEVWLEKVVARKSCGSKKLWLNKSPFLLEGLRTPAPPSNKKENLCDWGGSKLSLSAQNPNCHGFGVPGTPRPQSSVTVPVGGDASKKRALSGPLRPPPDVHMNDAEAEARYCSPARTRLHPRLQCC